LESQVQQIKFFGGEVNVGEVDGPRVCSLRVFVGVFASEIILILYLH
jgi:hypothetical protein